MTEYLLGSGDGGGGDRGKVDKLSLLILDVTFCTGLAFSSGSRGSLRNVFQTVFFICTPRTSVVCQTLPPPPLVSFLCWQKISSWCVCVVYTSPTLQKKKKKRRNTFHFALDGRLARALLFRFRSNCGSLFFVSIFSFALWTRGLVYAISSGPRLLTCSTPSSNHVLFSC